jgi:hypothetical protein
MKTRNLILAVAFGLGIIASSNVHAIDPISFSSDKAVSKTEMIIEKDIKVQDWMVDADVLGASHGVVREKNLKLDNWMIDGSWNNNKESAKSVEPELKVEDWMLKLSDPGEENVL